MKYKIILTSILVWSIFSIGLVYASDSTPPGYLLNSTNSTVAGQPALFGLKWADDYGLSGYIFSFNNGTGNWSNDTFAQFPPQLNTFSINGTDGWFYRKQHNITIQPNVNSTDYQMMFTIINGSGTDANGTVYLNNKARSDFGDIRFTYYSYSSGIERNISYFIDSVYPGKNATFWVKVPFISNMSNPEYPNNTIYIYYGNPSATSMSSGADTFNWFNDLSYTAGQTVGGGAGEDPGNLNLGDNTYLWKRSYGCGWSTTLGDSINATSQGGCFMNAGSAGWMTGYYFSVNGYAFDTKFNYTCSGSCAGYAWANLRIFTSWDGNEDTPTGGTSVSLEHNTDGAILTIACNSTTCFYYENYSLLSYASYSFSQVSISLDTVTSNDASPIATVGFDWVRVRNFVYPGPTHAGWGAEETHGYVYWSNVTKTINSTGGALIQWCVYANDTSNNWNGTSCANPFGFTTTVNTIITLESSKMNPERQIISRPGSGISLHGRAFYSNDAAYANKQLAFAYDNKALGSNTTDSSGYYNFAFSIPYEGTYNFTINGELGQNSTIILISTHPINVKYRLQYRIGSSKSNDIYRIGTAGLTNDTVDSLNRTNVQYSNNLTHGYVCSYDKTEYADGLSLGMVHSGNLADLGFVNFTTNSISSDYSIELEQMQDSSLILTFTKGTCQNIEDKMYLVESNSIPSRSFSSFSYPTPSGVPVLIQFRNDRIQINGSDRFSAGDNKICVQKIGISSGNKPEISVRLC